MDLFNVGYRERGTKNDNNNWEIVDIEQFMEGSEVVRGKKLYLALLLKLSSKHDV